MIYDVKSLWFTTMCILPIYGKCRVNSRVVGGGFTIDVFQKFVSGTLDPLGRLQIAPLEDHLSREINRAMPTAG